MGFSDHIGQDLDDKLRSHASWDAAAWVRCTFATHLGDGKAVAVKIHLAAGI